MQECKPEQFGLGYEAVTSASKHVNRLDFPKTSIHILTRRTNINLFQEEPLHRRFFTYRKKLLMKTSSMDNYPTSQTVTKKNIKNERGILNFQSDPA